MRPDRILWRSATRGKGRPTYGDVAFASFFIAIVSGVLLAIPYDISHAYESVARLRLINPAANYFRNLHYWSAQLFLISTVVHLWDHLRQSSERRVPAGAWARLTLSIPLVAFVMVSGFMLKGDTEGVQAWRIVATVTSSLPVIGRALSALLFGTGSDQQVVYVHHIATASIFLWLLVAEHARALRRDCSGCRRDIIDGETKMVNSPVRIALEKLCHRRIGARRLHQLDFRIAELDESEPHALLRVDFDRADPESVLRFELARRGVKARHDDGNMAKAGDHAIASPGAEKQKPY